MKTKPIILLYSCLLMLMAYSCSTTHQETSDDRVVEIDIYQTPAKQTDFIDEWHYVKLEARADTGLISRIMGFDIDDKHMLIISGEQDLYLYDHSGKLVSAINRHGGGPNEYSSIFDAKLHGDQIWVLCRSSKRLLVYDLEGHGIRSYNLPDRYMKFSFLDSDRLMFSADKCSNEKYDFVIYNLAEEKIEARFFPYDVKPGTHCSIGEYKPFICEQDDKHLFVDMFDYNIYEVGEDNTVRSIRRYALNTPFQLSEHEGETFNELNNSCDEGVRFLDNAYYDGPVSYQCYGLALNHYRKDYVYRYDERTGKGDLIECVISEDFPFLALAPLAFYKGWYITALELRNIEFIENKFGKKYIEGVDEDSNPVLIFHHFK